MIAIERVKRSFGRSAGSYDKYGILQKDVSSTLVRNFISPKLAVPLNILDAGSGTGLTAKVAKRRWKGVSIAELDISHQMLKVARKRGFMNTVQGDIANLPFKDSSFSLVISSLAMQWVHEGNVFKELFRVVKDEGMVAFSAMIPGTLCELRTAYNKASIACTGKEAVFPTLKTGELLQQGMEQAGFKDIALMKQSVKMHYGSVEELFATLKGIGATSAGRPSNLPRRDVLKKTVALYPRLSKNGDVEATYELIYISGCKG